MRIDVLTLFPKMFESPFAESIVARARTAGKLELAIHDLRAWATDRHRIHHTATYGCGIEQPNDDRAEPSRFPHPPAARRPLP